jgi:hypothetical protein
MKIISFPVLVGVLSLSILGSERPVTAGDKPSLDPKAIVTRGISARGGREKLALLERSYSRSRVTIGNLVGSMESWTELPDRTRKVACYEELGKKICRTWVTDGPKAWVKVNEDATVDVGAEDACDLFESRYQNRILQLYPILDDMHLAASFRGEFDVAGKKAECVRITSSGHESMELFFDKSTGLLVKHSYRSVNPQIKGKRVDVYAEQHRESGGVVVPCKVSVRIDDQPFSVVELEQFRVLTSFPNGTFAKP